MGHLAMRDVLGSVVQGGHVAFQETEFVEDTGLKLTAQTLYKHYTQCFTVSTTETRTSQIV